VLWRMVLWRMVLWRMVLWKRLSTSRSLQSLQAQRSVLSGARTGLQVANWGTFSRNMNKAEEPVGFSAPYKNIKSKKMKGQKKKKSSNNKTKKKENEKDVEELAKPVPELRTLSGVGLF
ncbi:hypothetical protein IFM46972_09049, partial [Aspergillus udagawae]